MKRSISAVIILTACVIFAVYVNITLEQKAQSLHSVALTAVNDKNNVNNIENEWKKEIIYFKLFTDHSYFENIDKGINKLKYLSDEAYRNTCIETVIALVELKEHLSFSLSNIF